MRKPTIDGIRHVKSFFERIIKDETLFIHLPLGKKTKLKLSGITVFKENGEPLLFADIEKMSDLEILDCVKSFRKTYLSSKGKEEEK